MGTLSAQFLNLVEYADRSLQLDTTDPTHIVLQISPPDRNAISCAVERCSGLLSPSSLPLEWLSRIDKVRRWTTCMSLVRIGLGPKGRSSTALASSRYIFERKQYL